MSAVLVEVYQGRKQGRQAWRWRAIGQNNRKLATSGEAYTNKQDCIDAALLVCGDHVELLVHEAAAS